MTGLNDDEIHGVLLREYDSDDSRYSKERIYYFVDHLFRFTNYALAKSDGKWYAGLTFAMNTDFLEAIKSAPIPTWKKNLDERYRNEKLAKATT